MGEVIYLFGEPQEAVQRDDRLQSCTPVLVWFPSYGRNAWQSTWVNRYRNGALQASRREAEDYVAAHLKQGSNWGFQVLPGFHLQFSDSAYLLCEINTLTPFRNLQDHSMLQQGTSKSRCIDGLNPASSFWARGQSKEDGVIVQNTARTWDSFPSYAERTDDPRKILTIGSYRREKSEFGDWGFSHIANAFDLQFYEAVLSQTESTST